MMNDKQTLRMQSLQASVARRRALVEAAEARQASVWAYLPADHRVPFGYTAKVDRFYNREVWAAADAARAAEADRLPAMRARLCQTERRLAALIAEPARSWGFAIYRAAF